MIRRSASPAAAGGRRGGLAAGLLPASLVTVAAAASLRGAGRTRERLGMRMSVFLSGGRRLF